jgi:RNA polymerase sigma factor (sigma-70 family)
MSQQRPSSGPRDTQSGVHRVPGSIQNPPRNGHQPELNSALGKPGTSLSQLFRTQYRQLVGFCRIRIRSEADAEDIVQSAFLAARQAYPDKGAEELRPLLFTMVRNLSINHVKAHWNARRHGEDVSETELACPNSPTPEKLLMDAQHLSIAEAVLAAMPERRREVLRLHRFEGLTYEEIANRLSVGQRTVKRDVALAVAELAEGLARAGRPAD